ncbi:MAG: hypothetical protein DRI61_00200 [Chloroflexi bacterium]|nr:MAG: hypothetical protein DRI61_00200 [Chloroflexota bacterium]HDN80344.1 hypothetical protein [Chloroflexota bacterium]
MSSPFFPELHDLVKLVNPRGSFPTVDGKPLEVVTNNGQVLGNLDLSRLGLKVPKTSPTFQAILCAGNGASLCADSSLNPELRRCLFLLELAHRLASAFQVRNLPKEGQLNRGLYKLWQPQFNLSMSPTPPIPDASSLREALELALSPDKIKTYWERFSSYMQVRSDQDFQPFNIASLLSHSHLTSLFYRALDEKVEMLEDPWRLSLEGVEATSPEEAEEKWYGRLVWGQVLFYQQPLVPEDLKVFDWLKDCLRSLEESFPHNLMTSISNNFWMFLPGWDEGELRKVAEIFLKRGFYVRLRYQEMPLAQLGQSHAIEFRIRLLKAMSAELERFKNDTLLQKAQLEEDLEREEKLQAELKDEITRLEEELRRLTSPKTRSATRRRKREAEKRRNAALERINTFRRALHDVEAKLSQIDNEMAWVMAQLQREQAEKGKTPVWRQLIIHIPELTAKRSSGTSLCQVCGVRPVTDDGALCSICQEIREGESNSRIPAPWLSKGYLLWLYCLFEPRLWQHAILTLFSNYMDKSNPGVWEANLRFKVKTTLRWPVLLKDFISDYQDFLRDLELEICRLVGARNRIRLADDLWVIPINKGTKAAVLIRSYVALLEQYFPAFIPLADMPIFLGISIAPASQPFSEQWRYLRRPPHPISIRLPNQERLEVSVSIMKELIRYGEILIGYRQRRRPSLEQVRIEELIARNVIKRQDVKLFQQLLEWDAGKRG